MVRLAWPTADAFSWDKYENMWRAFICNRLPDNSTPSATDAYGMAWENHQNWIFHRAEPGIEGAENPSFSDWFFGKVVLQPPIFVSESDRYGWAVDGTRPGDRVAILYGYKYPFLLRVAGDGTYGIIGDCSIHGLMEGEALEQNLAEIDLVIS
ncbi:hypothetical protein K491DRAFT_718684 [Lophiostoma macrostomum CBS 122681]|uniref:Heterokaryon incompatibility domain-containing protein n=1 Tax=Lophiostoma macrostomum CBS 122681 TaxID=1314788 RepID=A0A6A6SYT3_9PLEO|nr:hypothetical protein K491DRAFT_718684 [Lophiostoma macrostomum CBS 122681]